jgi:hypothetical protein
VKTALLAPLVFSVLLSTAAADFSGPYAVPSPAFFYFLGNSPSNFPVGTWTLLQNKDPAFGMPVFYGSPSQINFDTSASLARNAGHSYEIQLVNTVQATGLLSFSYTITFPNASMFSDDQAGYTLDGVLTLLSAGSGSVSIPVDTGDTFGFYVRTGDTCITCSPSWVSDSQMQITNFSAPVSEPSVICLFLASIIGFLGAGCWRFYHQSA